MAVVVLVALKVGWVDGEKRSLRLVAAAHRQRDPCGSSVLWDYDIGDLCEEVWDR